MKAYTHGGDIWSVDGNILDFSANLNPLGMPPAVAMAAAEGAKNADIYPDPLCRNLREKIGVVDGVPMEWVLCGNGAADLIFRLVMATKPKKALVTAPTFSEYEEALGWVGCQVSHHLLYPDHQFALTRAILQEITEDLDILFLCTPNNPTGVSIEEHLMIEILQKCHRCNVTLVVDECFLGLSTGGVGLVPYLSQYPNLFLLRAFTKSYAMAGLRLGYGLCANESLLELVGRCGQPWSMSTPAQIAGIAALDCPDWPEKARGLLAVERPKMIEALQKLGLIVFQGEANYLLFQSQNCYHLKERLLERGILIRSCGNYHGLGHDYYRICIKTESENKQLLTALKEVL